MESTPDKPVEDIALHGNFNSNEVMLFDLSILKIINN